MSEIRCNEVLAEIERFVDGELPADRSVHLARHLEECSPCLDRADFQRSLRDILRRKCARTLHDTPEHLAVRVRAAIRAERVVSWREVVGRPDSDPGADPGGSPTGPASVA